MKPELIRFRKWLLESEDPITSRSLNEYDLEIRELYFNIFHSLMARRLLSCKIPISSCLGPCWKKEGTVLVIQPCRIRTRRS